MAERPLRLLIEIPPREGKSELLSHWTPVWFTANWPTKRVLLGTYEAGFASDWGRKARDEVSEHAVELGVKPKLDKWAANSWELETGGGMDTAGVGGPFTGKGGHLGIIDDPVKNIEEALSPVYREKTWDWYTRVFRTRIEPGGSIVGAMQRWHVDDLFGRIERLSGEKWEVIKMPMIAEKDDVLGRYPGERLWPERYSEQEIIDIRDGVEEDGWNAQYQQRPEYNAGDCFFDVDIVQKLRDITEYKDLFIGKYFTGRRYAAGIDCAGEGIARHSLTIKDCVTGLHVVQYPSDESVDEFALRAFNILEEFNYPLLGIESNGVGLAMINMFKGLGYKRFVYHNDGDKVGIASNSSLRMMWLVNYSVAIKNGTATPSTKNSIDEHLNFVKKPKGQPGPLPGCRGDQVMSAVWAEYTSTMVGSGISARPVSNVTGAARQSNNAVFARPTSNTRR